MQRYWRGSTGRAFGSLTATGVLLLGATALAHESQTRQVAVGGQEAPGTGGKAFDQMSFLNNLGFDEPMLGEGGEAAFIATFGGGSGVGVFLWNDGDLDRIAVTGQKTPAGILTGTGLGDFDGPAINGCGTVAFVARNMNGFSLSAAPLLKSPVQLPNSALFQKERHEKLKVIAKQGDNAPGCGKFFSFDDISENDENQVAFIASYDGGNKSGVFLKSRRHDIDTIVRFGDELPGTGGGTLCNAIDGPWLNNKGDVAFQADCIQGGTGGLEGSIFIKKHGRRHLRPLMLIGQDAPTGDVITDIQVGRPGLNDDSFVALFTLDATTDFQMIAKKSLDEDDDNFDVCMFTGDNPPDPLNGSLASNGSPTISEDGTVSFAAEVHDGSNITEGIFQCRDGKLAIVALQGDDKPDTCGGTFGSLEEASGNNSQSIFLDETSEPTGVFVGEPICE